MHSIFLACWKTKIHMGEFWKCSLSFDQMISSVLQDHLTCVWSTAVFHKVFHHQGQVGKVRPPHQFKHWGLSAETSDCYYSQQHTRYLGCSLQEDWPQLSCSRRRSTAAPQWHSTVPTRLVPLHKPALHTETKTHLYTIRRDQRRAALRRSHSLWWAMKCVRMRCSEPLCARSFSAPGQSGRSSTWYRAPAETKVTVSPANSAGRNCQMAAE